MGRELQAYALVLAQSRLQFAAAVVFIYFETLSVSDSGPPFATMMCDKLLSEEFVKIQVSFNGERFYKSCIIESDVRSPASV